MLKECAKCVLVGAAALASLAFCVAVLWFIIAVAVVFWKVSVPLIAIHFMFGIGAILRDRH